jgi:hypothetical protein
MNNELKYSENRPIEVVIEDLASLGQYDDYREYFKDVDIATLKDLLRDIQSAAGVLFYNVHNQITILKDLIAERVNAIASDEGTTIIEDIYYGIIVYIAYIFGYNDKRATIDIENSTKVDPAAVHLIENNLGYAHTKLIKYKKPIPGSHYTDPYLTFKFRYRYTTITLCLIDYDFQDDTIVLAYNINDTGWSRISTRFEFGRRGGYKFELLIAALLGVEDEVLFSEQMLTLNFLD